MTAGDTIAMAWANLDRRKGRTALTAAGVMIGVASLVLMVSLALGLQRQVVQLFETDESLRTLRVHRVKGDAGRKKAPSFGFGFDEQMVPMTDKDLEAIRKIPDVAGAWPEFNMFLRVTLEGGKGTVYPVEGIAPEEEAGYAKYVVAGSLWTRRDDRACMVPKVILESHLNLRPEEAIGRKVTFSGLVQEEGDASPEDVYTIAGVLGDEAFSFMGRPIVVPLDQGLSLRERRGSHPFLPSKKGSYLFARLRLKDPRAAQDVGSRLRNLGFNPLSAVELLKKVNIFFFVVEGIMSCIGAIGLVVSLFGIANTMAMAVLERTREIGIMKALGARNGDIGRLFLAEAGAIGALGGIVGLAGGALIGKLLNMIAHPLFDLPRDVSLFHVSVWLAAGSILFAVVISILAGWFPARRAARMEPVAAVRYE
jgi:putative ABC transport system permease protein